MTDALLSLTSPEVADLLRRTPVAVLPIGSVEQHGPHLPCGTDAIASELVAAAVADRLGALYVPFAPYGVTPIHAGHPGTISLRRETFEALLGDVCRELVRMGAEVIVLVNWHEGNTASLNAVATDVQDSTAALLVVAQACYVAQRLYAPVGGELTHGGGIETLAVMAADPALAKLDRAGRPTRPPGADAKDRMRRSHEVYGFVTDVSEIAVDGWYGDPWWATPERAATFAQTVADAVTERLDEVLALREDADGPL
jgi:creatinine amidohydrolase